MRQAKFRSSEIGCRCPMVILLMFFCISILLYGPAPADLPDPVIKAKNTITGDMILSHIDFLASPHCRGRETGEKGMDVAAAYIRTVLRGAGLQSAGDYGSYFQLVRLKQVCLGEGRLEIEETYGGMLTLTRAKLDWDYLPVYLSAEKEVTAPLAFAGYGITASEHNYDDYGNLNAAGKIVLVMRHEPGENDPQSPFDGRKLSNHATLLSKILNAQEHGAVGILFVTDPLNHEDLRPSVTGGTYWPSLAEERMKEEEDFQYMRFSPQTRIVGDDFGVIIPAASIDGSLAESLLGSNRSLRDIQKQIDAGFKPQSFTVQGVRITLGISFNNEPVEAFNIAAKVEGSDPQLKEEVVIVGAHYDHVGKDNRGQVFGGADDNASGTAAVLELARAFQNLESRPKRTIIFILFTAEEKGLLGARSYVYDPIFPLDKTVAMINLDMIGRNNVEQMSLIGRYQFPKLFEIIDSANKETVNFDLNFAVEEFIRQSDHFPFMREGVPSVFFNSGMHDELHTPRDAAALIIPEKAQKVAQLVFVSLWKLANLPPGSDLR